MNRMFSEVELTRDVDTWGNHLKGHLPPTGQILHRLLLDLVHEKACREHGFYLGVTSLKSIGTNKNVISENENHQSNVLMTFPVSFTCRTFLPARGDILQGTVSMVIFNGAFISSGPLTFAYLSLLKMPGYQYVEPESEDEEPCFRKDDMSTIGVGVVLRFRVIAVQFRESVHKGKSSNDLYVLATIEGDDGSLGPISLAGSDEPYM